MTDSMTVSELNEYTRNLLENDILLQMVSVSGEISNYKRHSSGHIYFTLKDEKSKINCSFFKNYNSALNFEPKNGMQVTVSATASLYPRDGAYQLLVYRMTNKGVGLLHEKFEALKAKLEEEGLFASEHKKAIPQYPNKIAVLASPTGAAVRDIISVTGRRGSNVEIVVVPVPVQGENASGQIAKALMYADNVLEADTIIIARGGGSIEELWAFNEEILARAVYACNTPVISGVGHETDFTICDFVADMRAPTPSVAAEMAVQNVYEAKNKIADSMFAISREILHKVNNIKSDMDGIMKSAAMQRPQRKVNDLQRECDIVYGGILQGIKMLKDTLKNKNENIISQITAMNPYNVLYRGFAIPYDKNNYLIKSVKSIELNDDIKIRFFDGNIGCTVNSVEITDAKDELK